MWPMLTWRLNDPASSVPPFPTWRRSTSDAVPLAHGGSLGEKGHESVVTACADRGGDQLRDPADGEPLVTAAGQSDPAMQKRSACPRSAASAAQLAPRAVMRRVDTQRCRSDQPTQDRVGPRSGAAGPDEIGNDHRERRSGRLADVRVDAPGDRGKDWMHT
jgi:hypothetical protein